MEIIQVTKNMLKWNYNIPTVKYDWNKLPILIDNEYNVLVGNSIRNNIKDNYKAIVITIDNKIKEALYYYETKIAEENKEERYIQIESQLLEYLRELEEDELEQMTLFDYYESNIITEDNYIAPSEEVTYAHGLKKDSKQNEEFEYNIDLEIMKELL